MRTTCPTNFLLIAWILQYCSVKGITYEFSHYEIFSIIVLFSFSYLEIFSSALFFLCTLDPCSSSRWGVSSFSHAKQRNWCCMCSFYVRKQDSGRFIVVNWIVKHPPFISNTTNSPKHLSCNLQFPAAGNSSCSLADVKGCPKYVQKSISGVWDNQNSYQELTRS